MAKVKFEVGAEWDVLTKDELDDSLAAARRAELIALAGLKHRKLPVLMGFASAAGALDIGGDNIYQTAAGTACWSGVPIGPTGGFAWMIKRLAVTGLTFGTTPDVVNMFQPGGHGPDIVWQFNGNSMVYTYGRGEIVLYAGESLRLVNQGTFASTSLIRLSGEMYQIPAEMIGKLL
jgi:hypothetical protein